MFTKGQRIHLVGIKGVGMTALAQVLKARGLTLSGSDTGERFFTDAVLKKAKIPLHLFNTKNITNDVDLVISSGAYFFEGKALANNPEIKEALKKNIPIISYPQAIGRLSQEYKLIAVSGSHGKSTTTAMLGWLLEKV
ncbi:MAG: Mur ligase domain-containing protein, partial [Candidatus Harrisonbacteria bacterium]|nr:Mur ligase domain-containing protein [Candidatus Harrisonbacteria bacterium]